RYRPGYPAELIEYVLQFVQAKNSAWDCATGNGQAAYLLAPHFQSVKATDISEKQIANSIKHPNIQYSVADAEQTPFPDHSFDLVTVAQAYHWFNFNAFENEAKRVLKSNGTLAVWGYGLVDAETDVVNSIIRSFYTKVVGPYWDVERKYVDDHYENVPFPYDQLACAEFYNEQHWSLGDLIGYINTWSSVQHFITAKGFNPTDDLKDELKKAWPSKKIISFLFPLFVRIGRIRSA
ncbi:MAG: class I SAM-dependent methyltransferase, partial [Flavitalea sp.]